MFDAQSAGDYPRIGQCPPFTRLVRERQHPSKSASSNFGRQRWNQHEALAPSDIRVADIVEKAGDRRRAVMNARPAYQQRPNPRRRNRSGSRMRAGAWQGAELDRNSREFPPLPGAPHQSVRHSRLACQPRRCSRDGPTRKRQSVSSLVRVGFFGAWVWAAGSSGTVPRSQAKFPTPDEWKSPACRNDLQGTVAKLENACIVRERIGYIG